METQETQANATIIDRLFKAGAHFGFSKSRRHPTVAPYLFGTKNGTDIFYLLYSLSFLDVSKVFISFVFQSFCAAVQLNGIRCRFLV